MKAWSSRYPPPPPTRSHYPPPGAHRFILPDRRECMYYVCIMQILGPYLMAEPGGSGDARHSSASHAKKIAATAFSGKERMP